MASLLIPRRALVVLCGPAGSGKSTFARRHFRPTAIVSSDRCRAMVGDDEANIAVSPLAFELFHLIVDLRLRQGRLTVADSTALRREARGDLLALARRYGLAAVLIVFDVSESRAQANNARRKRRVRRSVIHEQWERLQQALPEIASEGFDAVHLLRDDEARRTTIRWVDSSDRRPAPVGGGGAARAP